MALTIAVMDLTSLAVEQVCLHFLVIMVAFVQLYVFCAMIVLLVSLIILLKFVFKVN